MLLKHLLLALGALEIAAAFALPGAGVDSKKPNKKTCKKPNVRKEWRTLNPSEKRNYISAVSCLANTPKNPAHTSMPGVISMFDEFQGVHVQQTDNIHFVGHFIQWHRYMLDQYEKSLQKYCGLRGGMPYWDWTIDAASGLNMTDYPLFSATEGLGGNGPFEEAGPDVFFQIPGRTGGGCVQDGPFTFPEFSLSLDVATGLEAAAPHCLRRDFVPDLITFNLNTAAVDVVVDSPDFWWFSRNMEGFASFEIPNIHGGGHFGIGGSLGTMGNPYYSPGDPLFYLHHGNLDRVYWEWQKKDKAARTSGAEGVGANIVPWDYAGAQGNVTADFPIHMGEIAGVKRIDELLDIESGPFCYKYDTDN